MSTRDRQIEAVGLFTREDVRWLGSSLKDAYAVDEEPAFSDLLKALDTAAPGQPQPLRSSRGDNDALKRWQRAFIALNRGE